MTNQQDLFISYLKQYISVLTEDRKEFFLSLCDIEENLLKDLDVTELTGYQVATVDQKDYSEAVRLRNDIQVKQIVLLSAEGIKQIDSLKDFNEYSILPQNREILWECLKEVFQVKFEKSMKAFLDVILDRNEITFCELLEYLFSSIDSGTVIPGKLNKNLPKLGIWKCKSRDILMKGQIDKIIRASKFSLVESRLMKAIMENKITNKKKERIISNCISQGNIQDIFDKIYYEEVEEFFKNTPRNSGTSENNSVVDGNAHYSSSYEYKLLEQEEKDICAIEEEWIKDKDSEETESELELDWEYYQPLPETVEIFEEQIVEIEKNLQNMDLSDEKHSCILDKLRDLKTFFIESWEEVVKATPICLHTFCRKTEAYVQKYLELLSYLVLDEKLRLKLTGAQVIPQLLLLWCKKEDDKIIMPFYHPMASFYYMGWNRMYEYIVEKQDSSILNLAKTRIQVAAANKIAMLFPVEFLEAYGKLYMVDYTTVSNGGDIVFRDVQSGFGYSVLDFRIIQNQIIDYIRNHPFLTEINVAVLDISDLNGLIKLATVIKKGTGLSECNISRVTFRILSANEEELKKELAQMVEAASVDDMIRFRFGNHIYKNGQVDGNLEEIIREADMTILSDSSVLYYEPKMVANKLGNNTLLNRLNRMNVGIQVDKYFKEGNCDIPIMWDTLQHIYKEQDEGFWYWRSRAVNNQTFSLINQIVAEEKGKSIVLLSSNKDILSEINKTKYIQAQKRKYNGKTITILNFSAGNSASRLSATDEEFYYSAQDFYNEAMELDNILGDIVSGVRDISLKMYMKNEVVQCDCNLCYKDTEDMENVGELEENWKESCEEWLEWQFGDFILEDNIISRYYQELWANQCLEEAHSLESVLLVEKLCKGNMMQIHLSRDYEQDKKKKDLMDCMEAVKIHDLIGFVRSSRTVDERMVSQFKERFDKEQLERIIRCGAASYLLDKLEIKNITEIYERIKWK